MTTRILHGVSRSADGAEPPEFRPAEFRELSRFRTAAHLARRVYPGSLGELVQRELTAYADFGYRFSGDSLVHRLAAEVMDTVTERNGGAGSRTAERSDIPEATRPPAAGGRRRVGCTRL